MVSSTLSPTGPQIRVARLVCKSLLDDNISPDDLNEEVVFPHYQLVASDFKHHAKNYIPGYLMPIVLVSYPAMFELKAVLAKQAEPVQKVEQVPAPEIVMPAHIEQGIYGIVERTVHQVMSRYTKDSMAHFKLLTEQGREAATIKVLIYNVPTTFGESIHEFLQGRFAGIELMTASKLSDRQINEIARQNLIINVNDMNANGLKKRADNYVVVNNIMQVRSKLSEFITKYRQ